MKIVPRRRSWTAALGLATALGSLGSALSPLAFAAEPRPMSIQDCLNEALARNFDVQIDRINPRIAAYTLSSTYGDYDPNLTLNGQHSYTTDSGGIDSQNRPYAGSQSDTDALSASLGGLAPSGLSYSISANVSDTHGSRPGIDPNNPFLGLVPIPFSNSRAQWTVATLRQPVLRNFWIDSTRLNLRTRRNDLASSKYALALTVLNTITQVEQAYYDLVATLENVKNQQLALELAHQLYTDNRRKVELGALAQLDEKEAQSQVASSRASLIAAQAQVALAQNALKRLTTDRFETETIPDILPTEPLNVSPAPLDLQVSRERGLQLRPDLQQLNLTLENRKLGNRFQRNQLYPQLDLVGGLGYQGNGFELSDSLGEVSSGSVPFHSFGAVLTIPLSNRRARENYRIGQAQRDQVELQLRRLRQEIVVQVNDALVSAQSAFERVGATLEARQFAEAALKAEERKLASGKSTSFIVLQLQQRLTIARFDELRAQADYNKSLSTLRLREGSALQYHRIELPDEANGGMRSEPKP